MGIYFFEAVKPPHIESPGDFIDIYFLGDFYRWMKRLLTALFVMI